MTVKELCIFTEGFREPVVGVNRYGWKIAISLLSRLCKELHTCFALFIIFRSIHCLERENKHQVLLFV